MTVISMTACVLSAIYLSTFASHGFNIRDEWVVPHGAVRVLQGEVPWRDFQGYGPGPYYLHAAAFRLFGSTAEVSRGVMLLLTAMMVGLAVRAAAWLMHPAFATIAASLLLLAPGVYYGRYINFLIVLNIALFPLSLRGWPMAVVIGLVGGVSGLFRQDTGMIVLAAAGVCIAIAALPNRLRTLLALGAGAALPLGSWLAWLAVHGVIGASARAHANALAGGYRRMSLPYPRALDLVMAQKWGELVIFYGPVLVLGLMTFRLAAVLRRRRPLQLPDLASLYVFIVAVFTFHQALWRSSLENQIKVIAPILILAMYLVWLGWNALIRLARRQAIGPAATAVGVFALFAAPAMYAREVLTSPLGFYIGSRSVLREELDHVRLASSQITGPPHWTRPTVAAVRYLGTRTAAGESIFVVPFAPMFYFFTGRSNVSFFEWILPADPAIYSDLEPRVLTELDRVRPRYIVYEDVWLDGRDDRRFANYAPAVHAYISRHYGLEAEFADFKVLRRHPSEWPRGESARETSEDVSDPPRLPDQLPTVRPFLFRRQDHDQAIAGIASVRFPVGSTP